MHTAPLTLRWNDDYTDYITPSPVDADAIEKLFDALATHATRFEELGEDALAEMVRKLQDALYRSHAHYCVFGIERWRESDSYTAPDANKRQRHNRRTDSDTAALDDMCPWLLTIRNGLNARTSNSPADCKESEQSNAEDAPEAEVVDVLKLPYHLTIKKGVEGSFEVLPRASELATAAAERHYNESAAALDTETGEVLTALRARLVKKGQPAQASADAPKRKSIGWSGVKKQVLSATMDLAIDTAAVLSVLLIVATLYRIPVLFASMQKRLPYGESWRKIAMDNVLEIPVDLLYCAKVLLIFLAIRSVPSFLVTFTQQVSKKKTFETARKIVDYYCMLAWADILSLVTLIFSARALKWGLASVATGALAPGVLVERAFFPDCDHAFVAVSFVIAAAGYLYALPVIFFTQDADATGTPLAVILLPAGLLALAALYLVVETLRGKERMAEGVTKPGATEMVEPTWLGPIEQGPEKEELEDYELGLLNVHFVRMNWFNATQFLAPLLEAVFLVALVGKIAGASSDIDDHGSHGDDTFRKLFSYAFLEFHVGGAGASCVNVTAVGNETLVATLPVHDCVNSTLVTDGSAAAYPLGLWVALGCVVVYYFLISLPVVIAVVRDTWSHSICSQNAWVFLMLLLGYPMQIFIVYNLTSFVVCEDGGAGHSVLQFDEDVQCYVGTHAKVGKLALVALLFYVLTSLVKDAEFSTSRSVLLDVASLDLYELYVRVALVTAAFLGVVLRDNSTAVACVVAAAAAWCAFWTLFFPWALEVDHCVSVASYRLWRAYCYAGAVVGVVSVKVAHLSDSNTVPGWIVFGSLMFLLTAALAYQLYSLSCESTEGLTVTPEQVQEELLTVHATLSAQKQLGEQFNAAAWSTFVTGNVRSSQLALALMQLEHHTCLSGLDPLFLSLRKPWYYNVWRLVDEQDLRGSFLDRIDSYYYDDHFGRLFCDCFCSCSEYHYSRSGYHTRRRVNTVLDTPLLFELIKKFGNGVAARGNEILEDDVENQHSSVSGSSCADSVGTPPEDPLRSSLLVDSINQDRPELSLPPGTPTH